jgi:N-succinyldiaminopimelate aminotransferase
MFEKYPFEKLNELLKDIPHPKDLISLTIGEPQFETCLLYTSPSPRDS